MSIYIHACTLTILSRTACTCRCVAGGSLAISSGVIANTFCSVSWACAGIALGGGGAAVAPECPNGIRGDVCDRGSI